MEWDNKKNKLEWQWTSCLEGVGGNNNMRVLEVRKFRRNRQQDKILKNNRLEFKGEPNLEMVGNKIIG